MNKTINEFYIQHCKNSNEKVSSALNIAITADLQFHSVLFAMFAGNPSSLKRKLKAIRGRDDIFR